MLFLCKLVIIACVLNCSLQSDESDDYVTPTSNYQAKNVTTSNVYEDNAEDNNRSNTTHFSSREDNSIIPRLREATYSTCDNCTSTLVSSTTSYNLPSENNQSSEESSESKEAKIDQSTTNSLCAKCKNIKPKIINFEEEVNDNKINISWDALNETLDVCKFKYEINRTSINSIIPYFRIEKNNFHVFENLKRCEKYHVIVKTNNNCSFEDVYETTVFSEPEYINEIFINVSNGNTIISWPQANSEYCSKYKVYTNQKLYETEENEYTLEGNLYCQKIGVQTIREDYHAGAFTYKSMPGSVRNLKADNTTQEQLSITWEAPLNNSCVIGYNLEIFDGTKLYYNKTLSAATHKFLAKDLESCLVYQIRNTAVSQTATGKHELLTMITKIPDIRHKVGNPKLQYHQLKNLIEITWDPPKKQGNCITNYQLIIWDDDKTMDEKFDVKKNTSFILRNVTGCSTYNAIIKAQISLTNETSTDTLSLKIPPILPKPPKLREIQQEETSATLIFEIETKEENNCELLYFKYKCLASQDFRWTVREKSDFQDLSDETGPIISINITDLSEFTNYTCTVSLNSTAGFSEESKLNFRTLPAAPTKPQHFRAEDITSDTFDLSWSQPTKIPGTLKSYKLNITAIEPIHYIPNDCDVTEQPRELILDSSTLTFHYNLMARSNFKYFSAISAETIMYGEENVIEFNTTSGVPEKVREFKKTFNISEDEFSLILSWLYPCDSKGEIDYFLIELNSTENEKLPPDRRGEKVPVNDDIEDIRYSFELYNITSLFNYSVSIAAVLTDGTIGEQEVIYFEPPQPPSKPENFGVEIYADSFKLFWLKPANVLAEDLVSYKLNITGIEPLHDIPEGCEVKQESLEEILSGSSLSYYHNTPLPNYKYSGTIRAKTISYGKENKIEFITESGVPGKVRQFTHTFEISNITEYNVILTWLYPCNPHGTIDYFLIELNGVYSVYTERILETDVREKEVEVIKGAIKGDIRYTIKINGIRASYNYAISIVGKIKDRRASTNYTISGEKDTLDFKSPDGLPSSPIHLNTTNILHDSFYITWSPPINPNGELLNYTISINCIKPMHNGDCETYNNFFSFNVTPSERFFKFEGAHPHYLYEIYVVASTSAGFGNKGEILQLITKPTTPETVRNLSYYVRQLNSSKYEAKVIVEFDPPCHLNGNLSEYIVELEGTNRSDTHKEIESAKHTKFEFQLRPDYLYNISVVVVAADRSHPVFKRFQSPSGVPPFNNASSQLAEVYDGNATIILEPDIFKNDHGDVIYYAIIVCSANMYNKSDINFGYWNGNDWPEIGNWTNDSDSIPHYQTTPIKWNPFKNREGTTATFTIGEGSCNESDVCNGPLRPNTPYVIQIRGFTKNAYRDEGVAFFTTLPEDFSRVSNVALVTGIIGGCLAALITTSIMIFYVMRRRQPKTIETVEENVNLYPQPISIRKFPQYYKDFKDKPYILKTEFVNLNNKSAEQELPTTYALLTENRKKNRYINILPYDDRRVILQNDDSDYINASYIDGYSNSVEYLATQGPLESTLNDFWRMIFDEDIAVIVMVAQFVEQKKDKCYKYIPNKQEEIELEDEMKIRCTTELKFDYYCERQLTIQKDGKQRKIVHLQFMDWPDFGCPDGTENMLDFCCTIRRHMNAAMGKIVVHCSAGVGRTGTLIAIDILLQAINDNKDVDVFNTVLDLRKQRKNMVQTEAQYVYIYSCINDAIINPPSLKEIKATEPIYENVNDIEMKILKSDDNENIEEKE